MSFIEHEPRSVAVLQFDDLTQRRRIAIHAEDGFRDDQRPRAGLRRAAQELLQLLEVIVRKHAHRRAAQSRGIDERGVTKLVEDNGIILAHQRRNGAERDGVAAGETQRGLRAFEARDFILQLFMWCERAADES